MAAAPPPPPRGGGGDGWRLPPFEGHVNGRTALGSLNNLYNGLEHPHHHGERRDLNRQQVEDAWHMAANIQASREEQTYDDMHRIQDYSWYLGVPAFRSSDGLNRNLRFTQHAPHHDRGTLSYRAGGRRVRMPDLINDVAPAAGVADLPHPVPQPRVQHLPPPMDYNATGRYVGTGAGPSGPTGGGLAEAGPAAAPAEPADDARAGSPSLLDPAWNAGGNNATVYEAKTPARTVTSNSGAPFADRMQRARTYGSEARRYAERTGMPNPMEERRLEREEQREEEERRRRRLARLQRYDRDEVRPRRRNRDEL